ncbi:acyl carrier protein [Salinispora vitiensis]|uniref:acyl carrier protein n=1 Tax=Salinispora vitiensis TaxID=999544 RepID=UPI000371E0F8|nr:acyl carrier protein [Salinispora vitiensis]
MNRDEIRAALAEILEEVVGLDAAEVTEDKSFIDDLDVDSLSMVEVLVALDERLGVRIPDDEVANLVTIGDAMTWIEKSSK